MTQKAQPPLQFVVPIVLAWASLVLAQDTGQEPDAVLPSQTAQSLMADAYQKTKTAKTLDEFNKIIELCVNALQESPSGSQMEYTHKLLAWTHSKRGELFADQAARQSEDSVRADFESDALEDFNRAVQLDPNRWKSYHNRGVSYAMMGQYEAALADFDRTIQLNRDYVNAWYNRAGIRYEQADYARAVRDYTEVIRRTPDDASAFNGRAHSQYHLRRFREALTDYARAVQLDGDNAEYYTDRADAHAHLGYWNRAAADYRQAVRIDNTYGRAYLEGAWLLATCPLERYQISQLALVYARRAIELDGMEDYRYLDTLAAAHAAAGNFKQAQSTIQSAIDKAPEEAGNELNERLELYKENQPYRQPQAARRGYNR